MDPPPDTHSIPLWQVLAEEYKSIHGALPSCFEQKATSIKEKRKKELKKSDAGKPAGGHGIGEAPNTIETSGPCEEQTTGELPLTCEMMQAENEVLLPCLYKVIHARANNRSALCFSGGGIRSATFNLGLLQGLAQCGLLSKFHYLSTVSGGGYIGAWLSAWIHNQKSKADVIDALAGRRPPPPRSLNPEPEPIQHLRQYSNYLSPRLGLLSADSWTLFAIFCRNLLLNWLILVPFFAAVLMVPRFAVRGFKPGAGAWASSQLSWLLPVGTICLIWAISYMDRNRPGLMKFIWFRPNWKRGQSAFLWLCWLPLLISAVLLPLAWVGVLEAANVPAEWTWLPSFMRDWLPTRIDRDTSFHAFAVYELIVAIASWILNIPAIGWKRARGEGPRALGKMLFELVAICLAGIVAAAVLSAFAHQNWLSGNDPAHGMAYVVIAPAAFLLAFLVAGILLRGLLSEIMSDGDREWAARSAAWILIAFVAWLAGTTLVLFGPTWLACLTRHRAITAQALVWITGSGSGVITAWLGHSTKTPAKANGSAAISGSAVKLTLAIAPALFILAMALGVAILTDRILGTGWFDASQSTCAVNSPPPGDDLHRAIVRSSGLLPLTLVTLTFLAVSFLAGFCVNVNKFSLHGLYRNRLVRAYLGASRRNRSKSCTFNRFTGFDPEDNVRLHELRGTGKQGLFHVVNMALNLVGGENLAWQQRKAESFTATPLHCGSGNVGYRDSTVYGGGKRGSAKQRQHAMSLGTAIAISGAAVSPNMGYHSSPLVTFVMTLFNVRLGAWLGNPGPAGDGHHLLPSTYGLRDPRFANRSIIEEAFGLTDDRNPYVYLSDGGHFENLGLYEMVRRRCHFIVVGDAGQDEKCAFEDLGNAIRKISIDMGVSINFSQTIRIFPRDSESKKPRKGYYCALATIDYRRADGDGARQGELIYIKPAIYGDEPADVYNYAKGYPSFPHETTANQFFTESQFESYRRLGQHIGNLLYPEPVDGTPSAFMAGPCEYLGAPYIASVTPASGPHAGGATAPVTLKGFFPTTTNTVQVFFGDALAVPPSSEAQTVLELNVPPPSATAAATVDVMVRYLDAQGRERSRHTKYGAYTYV